MPATYTKLRDGSWGIRVTGETVKAGQTIRVVKKSGEAKTETVARVLCTGDGVTLASVGAPAATPTASRPSRSGGQVCCECGKGGRLVIDLEDGAPKHYGCCDIPPGGY